MLSKKSNDILATIENEPKRIFISLLSFFLILALCSYSYDAIYKYGIGIQLYPSSWNSLISIVVGYIGTYFLMPVFLNFIVKK